MLSAITLLHLLPDKVPLQVGDYSPVEVRAPRNATYEDTAATEALRQQRLGTVSLQYDGDVHAAASAESAVNRLFTIIRQYRTQPAAPLDARVRRASEDIERNDGLRLAVATVQAALTIQDQTLETLRTDAQHLVLQAMSRPEGIRQDSDDLQLASADIAEKAGVLPYPPAQRDLVRAVAQHSLRPTLLLSAEKTAQAKKRVAASVQPVIGEIFTGDVVVQKGELVTPTHLAKLTALGLRNRRIGWLGGFYVVLFIAGIVAITGVYLYRYHRRIYNDRRLLLLLSLVVILGVLAFKVGGTALGIKLDTNQYGYFGMLSLSTMAMLIAVLLAPDLAVVVAALLSLHIGVMTNLDLRFAAVALVSSLVGILSFARIRDRGDLVRTLLVLCVANTLAIWVLGNISRDSVQNLVTGVAWGIGSSVLSSLITWLGVALLERPFGVTTHIGLLELSDMNQPALRRLLQEAPGTYIHSLNVGQLAEAAAEAVGADALLARVGAYYHDIGKVMRPYCFVENQTVENIHNRLNPTLSSLVVTSHIKDGADLAREYRLPEAIVEIIRSHHGTGLVRYFYHQAMLASEGDSPVPEHQFRYEGPRPHSKEAGIIMLADSVEGAVRSALADRPDPGRIQAIVARVIKDKAGDGQLDECDLTFRDLSLISNAFTRILQSIFHARIKYPEPLTAEGQRLNAISNSAPAGSAALAVDAGGSGADSQQLAAP